MERKSNGKIIAISVLVAVAIAIGAYFTGQSVGRSDAETKFKAEQDLSVSLNLSELDGLGQVKGTIYVAGHKSPDSDTVGSAIAYAALLRELGYDAQAVVLGGINNETKYILEAAGVPAPEELVDASGENMVLIDHSEYAQSSDGLEDANILGIIDHHGAGGVTTSNQIVYDARPLGSTATIVWIRYRNFGVQVDPQIALVMLGSILSDTKNLQSDNTTDADRKAVKALSSLAGLESVDDFYRDMYKASISYEGMTDEEVFFSDWKEYEAGGKRFCIGCVEAYDEEDARDMAQRMRAIMPTTLASTGMDYAFAQVSILHDDVSITYLVPAGDVEQEVLQEAFCDRGEFDGVSLVCKPGFSRRQVTAPGISDFLAAHPSE